jgi:dihydroorotate dehydrogenase
VTLYDIVRPVFFKLPPEVAHSFGKNILKGGSSNQMVREQIRSHYQFNHRALKMECLDSEFPNPIGIAAGFDKNGEITKSLIDLGFGFAEIGTVTPDAQDGESKPRLFRLPKDAGMINRLAFNGEGADRVKMRMKSMGNVSAPISVNIGKMNQSGPEDAIEDYVKVFETLYEFPDYFVINVSCPNTPEVYDESSPERLSEVFGALQEKNRENKPIAVKVGPDYDSKEKIANLSKAIEVAEDHDIKAIVATNTTTDHSQLKSKHGQEWGGVSGRPLEQKATETVECIYGMTDLPVIGVGGVDSAESAYRKIRHGASLVQIYTGFVYKGPSLARQITRGLVELLEKDGYASIEEVVGIDCKEA